jgi:cysteine desulfurase/selenocysteine lyase
VEEASMTHLSVDDVRKDIPVTSQVIYFDNAATTPVPMPVLDAMMKFWVEYPVTVERGAYRLAAHASEVWDGARQKAARLLLNCDPDEFIFTRNFTEGACMLAYGLEQPLVNRRGSGLAETAPVIEWKKGDNIVFSNLDHHSNMMPWMRLAYKVGVHVKPVEFNPLTGTMNVDAVVKAVDKRTKLVALQQVSNVTGVIHPVKAIVREVKTKNPNCLVFVDGSQACGHMPVDVKDLGCDGYGFSGHKGPLGPHGSGGLYVRSEVLERMDPLEVGGGTISDVTEVDYALRSDSLAKRWEAGTPSIACLIGLGRAAEYVANEIGLERIEAREKRLLEQLLDGLQDLKDIEVYGTTGDTSIKTGLVSFNIKGWDCTDVSIALDSEFTPPILTRAGHHCAIPAMRRLGVYETYGGTVRMSFHFYNTGDEVEQSLHALKKLV